MRSNDTIVAPATPQGEAALALIRVSGPQARSICAAALGSSPLPSPRKSSLRHYYIQEAAEPLDQLLCTFFPGPHSYTGEDVVELAPHGNPFIVKEMLKDLCQRGCRMAEPGEFTRRAFLNGKMDLSQAEAVAEVIHARSKAALHAAHRQLSGSLARTVADFTDRILHLLAQLEAYIDFPEEDLPPESVEGPLREIAALSEEMKRIAASCEYRERLMDGWKVVIIGAPNAGKSSLLNHFVGEDRALVSDVAGTTRDYLRERIEIGQWCIYITDTAGIRSGSESLEQLGIERSIEQAKAADLCLLMVDRSAPLPDLPEELLQYCRADNTIVLFNKSDLRPHGSTEGFLTNYPRVDLSLRTGEGLNVLRGTIEEWLGNQQGAMRGMDVLVSRRHAESLRAAGELLASARLLASEGEATELVAIEVRQAIVSLEAIVGRFDNEAVLDRLFAQFCIGK